MTGDTEATSMRQRVGVAAVCAGILLVSYVLSIGPAAWLHGKFELKGFQAAIEFIYAPLIAVIESDIDPFASMLKWYVELFQ